MPYIPETRRFAARDTYFHDRKVETPGDAAFLIADIIESLLPDEASFADRALAVGVLEASLHEAKRQLLDDYEDGKMHQNGAVYSSHERGSHP